ncbi:MAG: hypothetical protein ABIJ31_15995 [Pseudomonadota bacterium]
MQKKFLNVLLTVSLLVFVGFGSAVAAMIDFESSTLYDSNPTIAGVHFFSGDPASYNDAIVYAYQSDPNQFLLAGYDDGTSGLPGFYDSFIGATATGGFTFDTITLDFAAAALPGAVFGIEAFANGASVASTTVTPSVTNAYSSVSISFSTGFDTLYI